MESRRQSGGIARLSHAGLLVLVLAAMIASCDSQEPEPKEPGIVLGKSIAGVELEMDSTDVLEILGEPDEIIHGDFPGVIYEYTTGDVATLEVEFSGLPQFGTGVAAVCATSPYEGETESGLGLGSLRKQVFAQIGDSLHQVRNESEGSTHLCCGLPFRSRDYYNLDSTILEIEMIKVEGIEKDELAVSKICMTALPDESRWGRADSDPFVRTQYGVVTLRGLFLDCTVFKSLFTSFRVECLGIEENSIPEGIRRAGAEVLFSGYQKPMSLAAESEHLLVINTIREVKK